MNFSMNKTWINTKVSYNLWEKYFMVLKELCACIIRKKNSIVKLFFKIILIIRWNSTEEMTNIFLLIHYAFENEKYSHKYTLVVHLLPKIEIQRSTLLYFLRKPFISMEIGFFSFILFPLSFHSSSSEFNKKNTNHKNFYFMK